MAIFTGALNALAILAWLCLMAFLYAAGGGRPWNHDVFVSYCGPLLYFAICLVTTLPFIRGKAMLYLGILAHLILIPFVISILSQGTAALPFVVPFVVLASLWYATYRTRRSAPEPERERGPVSSR
jgi:phosphatidylserine synthase